MNDVARIEAERLIRQAELDARKSPRERNRQGQFATPPALAQEIARYAMQRWPKERPVRFLDPAIGTGAFYSALCHAFPRAAIERASGIELDPAFAGAAATLWGERGLQVIEGDFTRARPPSRAGDRYNLVLTNPPYVRHHHLDRQEKLRLQAEVARDPGLALSGLAGLYCHFLLLCDRWLAEDGLSIWLIPSEFMDVNYGDALRRYLTERVTLHHIHRFCPADVQFGDALVTSAVVVFTKQVPPAEHVVRFSLGGSVLAPQKEEQVPRAALLRSGKWTAYPGAGTDDQKQGRITLGDLFTIRRGLATGANHFFILPRRRALELGIPPAYLRPILPSPRLLSGDVIEAGEDGFPRLAEPLALIDCPEPEEVIRVAHPAFYQYLLRGKEQGIHEGYLTSRRTPWYAQERRPPAPFMCTYMGRGAADRAPFRFLWNRSAATAANVYLMLYPRGPLKEALNSQPGLHASLLAALNSIRPEELIGEGRVYGGGLYKLEPKELERIPAAPLLELMPARARPGHDLFTHAGLAIG